MNPDIRILFIQHNVRQYEVADALGISEYTFCRWLRSTLTPERKALILAAINRLSRSEAVGQ